MKKLALVVMLLSLAVFSFVGCGEDEPDNGVTPPETATAVYVLNSAATSISVIDLETGDVTNDVVIVGMWPNQLVYRDGTVYCVNSGSNNIMIFDADTWETETPVDLGAGNNPMNMVFYDDNTVFVSCSVSGKVLKVNLSTKTVTTEIDAGIGTTGIGIKDGVVYASNTAYDGETWTYGQGTVTVIDAAAATVTTTIDVGTNPQSLAEAPDGTIHVVCSGDWGATVSGEIHIIDPATNTVTDTIVTGGSPGIIGISEGDNLAYLGVWGMGCLVYNTATHAMVFDETDYFLGKGGTGVLVGPEGNVFVSVWDDDQVIQLDSEGTVLETFNVGDSPAALAMKTSY